MPPRETLLLAPAATLVVRRRLPPGARGPPAGRRPPRCTASRGLFEAPKQFPSPDHLEFPLLREAERYHTLGAAAARPLPAFWAATLVDRIKVLFLPLLVLVRWRAWCRRSIAGGSAQDHRKYRDVVDVDQALSRRPSRRSATSCWTRLDRIEDDIRGLRVPLGYADAHYHLRMHLELVRAAVQEMRGGRSTPLTSP